MTDHRRRIEDLLAEAKNASARAAAARPAGWPNATDAERDAYFAAATEYQSNAQRLWDGVDGELDRLRRSQGTTDDIHYALAFLELDLYFFRSGYLREKVARHLARYELTDEQRTRARVLVLDCVDGRKHTPIAGIAHLAGATANNAMRRALRERLHSNDGATAWKALAALNRVKHPGLTALDLAAARTILLRRPWVPYPLAFRYLSPNWEAELRDIAAQHGEFRAGAKDILRRVDFARENKRVRAPRPAHQPDS